MKNTYSLKIEKLDACFELLCEIYNQLECWIAEQENSGCQCGECVTTLETLEMVQSYINERLCDVVAMRMRNVIARRDEK